MAAGDLKGTLTGSGASVTASNALTGSVAVAIGDLVFVVFGQQTALTASGATDNLGNAYTAQNAGTDAGNATGRAFWSRVTVAGTLTTVTVAATASANDYAGVAAVIEGPFAATSPLDKSPANTDITTPASPFTCPATTTLSQANEVVMCWGVANQSTVWAATSPNLLANNASPSANIKVAVGYQKVAATTSVSPAFTAAANPTDAAVGTASFKLVPFVKIQSATAETDGTSTTSISVTLPAAVTSGNHVLGYFSGSFATGITVASIQDDKGNNYPLADSAQGTFTGCHSFLLTNITNGPITVTFTLSATGAFFNLVIEEIKGSTSGLDVHTINFQSGVSTAANAVTSGSVIPAAAASFAWGPTANLGTGTASAGTGWTADVVSQPSGLDFVFTEYIDNQAASALAATFTSSASDDYITAIMVLGPPASALSVSGSDTLSLSETRAAIAAAAGSDALTLSETPPAAMTAARSGSDALSLSDIGVGAATVAGSDTLSLSDTSSVVAAVAGSDALTLSETPPAAMTATRSGSDALSLSDVGQGIAAVTGSDTLSLSETPPATMTAPRSGSDTLSLSDTSTASSGTIGVSGADTLSLSDTGLAIAILAGSDTLSLSDAPPAALTAGRSGSDALSLSETQSGALQTARSESDALSLSDTADANAILNRAGTDALSLSETPPATMQAAPSGVDALSFSDVGTLSTGGTFGVGRIDTLSLGEAMSAALQAALFGTDTLSLSDSGAASVSGGPTIWTLAGTDTLSLIDFTNAEVLAAPPLPPVGPRTFVISGVSQDIVALNGAVVHRG